jgi:hypothetical protein
MSGFTVEGEEKLIKTTQIVVTMLLFPTAFWTLTKIFSALMDIEFVAIWFGAWRLSRNLLKDQF